MKLGIDLDGVVVDFVGACADILGYYKAEDVKLWDDVFSLAGMGAGEFFEVVRKASVFEQALPVTDAVPSIFKLIDAGHEIHFVTSRPEWATEATRNWVRWFFGKEMDGRLHILSNHESKSSVSCDLYLDDAPHVLMDLMDNHRRVVRYERPWNKDSKDWDFSVANWEQFVTLVDDIKNRKATPAERWMHPGPKVAATMAFPTMVEEIEDPRIVEMSGTGYARRDVETVIALDNDEPVTEEKWEDAREYIRLLAQEAEIDRRFAAGEFRVTDPKTGGQKGTKKQRMELLPWDALMKVSEHYGAGAEKYEARNYERGYAWGLSAAALLRHFAAWWQGEELDDDGLEHLNAVVFHALTLRTFALRGIGTDDRP
jgi:hypothetical protein